MRRRRTHGEQALNNDGPDLEEGDQRPGEEPQDHQPRRKQRELEQALQDAQGEVLATEEQLEEVQQILQEREAEIERLKTPNAQPGPNARNTENRPQATANDVAHNRSDSEAKEVRTAGRRCCVLHIPWMQTDSLFDTDVRNAFDAILTELEANRAVDSDTDSNAEKEDPADEFWRRPPYSIADPVDIVRELVAHMDLSLARKWFEPWFKKEFRTGMRKMRSDAASAVANNRHIVFGLPDEEFGERHDQRARENGAKALLKDDAYMWAPDDPDDSKTEFERFFRGDVTLNASNIATKLILKGNSSVKSENRSAQAGPSRAVMWRVKAITPSTLSFIAIVIHFVLSGDTSFEMVSRSGNHMDMYEGNLRLLQTHKRKYPRAHRAMLKFYNEAVLPEIHSAKAPVEEEFVGMSSAAKNFYLRMAEGGEGEQEEENEQEGDTSGVE